MKKVMVAIEESGEAPGLATMVAALAGPEADVDVVHAVELGAGQSTDAARQAVATAVDLVRARGTTCHGHVETTDRVARQVVGQARVLGADLVVMGSRGLTGLAAVSRHSISHAVLAELDVPVLILPCHARLPQHGFRRVFVAVRSEWDTSSVVAAVAQLPDVTEVLVAHVPRWAALHVAEGPGNTFAEIGGETSKVVLGDAVRCFAHAGIPVAARTLERSGDVADAIAEAAQAWDADLIVVGSRRPGVWGALVTGSTAHQVLHHGGLPVLVAARRRPEHAE